MSAYSLVVFDMAGTTVRDRNEVKQSFVQAADSTGLAYTQAQYQALRGFSKREVFVRLWTSQLGADAPSLTAKIDRSFAAFRQTLEDHYRTAPVEPTDGCLECFALLKRKGIAIGLTTGFYREVADIVLGRLGWDKGLDARRAGSTDTIIQASLTSNEVENGRPAPDMIRRIMELTGIDDPQKVIKIGDTPIDLEEGRNAGCGLSLAVTNGSHCREQLESCPNDGLLDSLHDLKRYL